MGVNNQFFQLRLNFIIWSSEILSGLVLQWSGSVFRCFQQAYITPRNMPDRGAYPRPPVSFLCTSAGLLPVSHFFSCFSMLGLYNCTGTFVLNLLKIGPYLSQCEIFYLNIINVGRRAESWGLVQRRPRWKSCQYKLIILCHLHINLHHIHTHLHCIWHSLQRVFPVHPYSNPCGGKDYIVWMGIGVQGKFLLFGGSPLLTKRG